MNIAISKQQIGDENINSVNARELHSFLDSKQQFADWIKNRISKYEFVDDEDFTIHKFMNGKATQIDYIISLDMAKELSMVENNSKGRQARKYFIKCEKKYKNNGLALPNNYKEALQLLLAKEEELEEACKTKAYISDKKTATALNTASQMSKKVSKLEIELDKSKEYSTIKRMSMLTHGNNYDWRELKEVSNLLRLKPIDVFDANYGKVKAYHKDVWLEVYAIDLSEVV